MNIQETEDFKNEALAEEGMLLPKIDVPLPSHRSSWKSTTHLNRIRAVLACIVLFFFLLSVIARDHRTFLPTTGVEHRVAFGGVDGHIDNSTLGFGKIYVMSLKDRKHKQDELRMMAAHTNIDLKFLPGFPLECLTNKVVPAMQPDLLSHPLTRAELACYRSHMDAWSQMLRDGIETALFLEDDVDWSISIRKQLKALRSPLLEVQHLDKTNYGQRRMHGNSLSTQVYPGNWELLNFGVCVENAWWKEESQERFHKWPPIVVYGDESSSKQRCKDNDEVDRVFTGYRNMSLAPHQRFLQRSSQGKCLSSYALTRRGAARLLYYASRQVTMPIDNLPFTLSRSGKFNTFNVIPPLMDQWKVSGHHNSDIQPPSYKKANNMAIWYPSMGSTRVNCSGTGSLRHQLGSLFNR